jgi:hypothetical protein
MKNADHPIWPILRTTILMVSLAFILWLTAEKYDITELRTIIGMFMAAIGAEAVPRLMQKK